MEKVIKIFYTYTGAIFLSFITLFILSVTAFYSYIICKDKKRYINV